MTSLLISAEREVRHVCEEDSNAFAILRHQSPLSFPSFISLSPSLSFSTHLQRIHACIVTLNITLNSATSTTKPILQTTMTNQIHQREHKAEQTAIMNPIKNVIAQHEHAAPAFGRACSETTMADAPPWSSAPQQELGSAKARRNETGMGH